MGERIDIEIADKVSPHVANKINAIGLNAERSHRSLVKLQEQLKKMDVSSVEKLATASAKVTSALAKETNANARLITAKAKMKSVDDATALAKQKLATETERTNAAKARATIVTNKNAIAQQKLAQETAKALQQEMKAEKISNDAALANKKLATEAQRSAQAQQRLATESVRTAREQENLKLAQERLTKETLNSERALNMAVKSEKDAATASHRLTSAKNAATASAERLKVAQNNAAASALRLKRAQLQTAKATSKSSASFKDFIAKAARISIIVYALQRVASAILDVADSFTLLQNKLRVVATSEEQVVTITNELYKVARRSRTGVMEIAKSFQRFDMALTQLGASQKESVEMTETVAKALTLSGAATSEKASALLQLSQAFNKGKLDGDEFRSVMELMPVVADSIAKQLGVTRGELLKLAPEGKITAEVMRQAFASAREEIAERFLKIMPTVGDSFVVLKDRIGKVWGEFNKATGLTRKSAEGILWIADSIETAGKFFKRNSKIILTSLKAIGAALAIVFAPAILAAAVGGLKLIALGVLAVGKSMAILTAIALSNPLVLLAAGAAALLTYLYSIKDETLLGVDSVTTLGDAFSAAFEIMSDMVNDLKSTLSNLWDSIARSSAQSLEATTEKTKKETGIWNKLYGNYFETNRTGWAGFATNAAQTIDAILGFIKGFMKFVGKSLAEIVISFKNAMKRAYNAIATFIEDAVNVVIKGVNKVFKLIGKAAMELVKLEKMKEVDTGFKSWGALWAESMTEGFDSQGGYFSNMLEKFFGRAQAKAQKRLSDSAGSTMFENEYKSTGNLREAGTAVTKTSKRKKTVDRAGELAKINAKLSSQINLLYMLAPAREKQQKLDTIEQKLLSKKIKLSNEEREVIKGKIQTIVNNNKVQAEFNRLYSESKKPFNDYLAAQIAADKLLKASAITRTRYNEIIKDETDKYKKAYAALNEYTKKVYEAKAAMKDALAEPTNFQAKVDAGKQLLAEDKTGNVTKAGVLDNIMGQDSSLLEGTKEQQAMWVESYRSTLSQIKALREANLIEESTAEQMRYKAKIALDEKRLQSAKSFFNNLASLSESSNKRLAAIGKAAAITTATIDGIVAIQKAWASAPYPYNLPAVASTTVAQAANVAQIAGIGFQNGGSFIVGGTGGVDSQQVSFMATPGERVEVNTPRQVRKGDSGTSGNDGSGSQQNIRIINTLDPAMVSDYLATSEGEQVLINTIRNNSDSIKRIVNG